MSVEFTYGGRDRLPGYQAAIETQENEFLFGPYPAQYFTGLQVDGAARDVGNTGKTHILRAGLLMGLVTATNKLKEWSPTAQDGTEYVFGILKEARTMQMNGSDTDRLTGHMVLAGGLLANRLIVPGTTAKGISGNALEMLIRQQLRGRFIMNDTYMNARPEYFIHTVSAAEASDGITLTAAQSHREYHSTAAVAITLPTTPFKGVKYTFYGEGAIITVGSGSSNIKVPGVALAASLAVEDEIQEVIGDGSQWLVRTY